MHDTEPTLDAGPTLAAEIEGADTEHIHAWSEADDSEVEVHRRSWKLPIAIVSLAVVGLVAVGTVLAWPHPAKPAAKVTTQPSAPSLAPANASDLRFSQLLRDSGVVDTGSHAVQYAQGGIDPGLVNTAHSACTYMDQGGTVENLVGRVQRGWDISQPGAAKFVTIALSVYCPQHLS
jgi:hypothetical protein